jgi:UDP-N-acetylglucosamine 3-dehydrogenase
MKVAVIGTGNMGKHHVRAYHEMEQELVGITDVDVKKAKELAAKYNTKAYKNYEEMIKKEKPEAVSLAVPTELHAPIGVNLLEKGINVLVEKPIAPDLQSARKLSETAGKNKAGLMVGHIERFNPAVQKVKQLLEKKEVIALSSMRVGPHPPQIIKTGVILDMGIHDLDLIPYLSNQPVKTIYAKTRRVFTQKHDDSAHIFLTTDDTSSTVLTNWITPRKIRNLYATLEDRFLYLNYLTQDVYAYKKEVENDLFALNTDAGIAEKVIIEKEEPLKKELEAFLDYCKTEKNPCPPEEATKALKLALLAEQSSQMNEVIRV